jgi:hypothetical protein
MKTFPKGTRVSFPDITGSRTNGVIHSGPFHWSEDERKGPFKRRGSYHVVMIGRRRAAIQSTALRKLPYRLFPPNQGF